MYKNTENRRTKEQRNKRSNTREQGDKRTTYCNKVKWGALAPPLDVFSERTRGQEDRVIWRAKLYPQRAPCKGRVLMTTKQKDMKTIVIKYTRTSWQDNKISKRTRNTYNTWTRTKQNERTKDQLTSTREQGDK